MELTRELAQELCDSIELYSDFFDEDNEEYILLKENNPTLIKAYEVIYTLANSDVGINGGANDRDSKNTGH